MTDQAWLARYNARRSGQVPQQPPPVQQPPPGYPPPNVAYNVPGYPPPQVPQPPYQQPPQVQPMGPPHAPFGYDPQTGVPVAPYGRDQYGNIVVQPYVQPYAMPQQPGVPMHDARGQVLPMGYGQPPYGSAQQMYPGIPGGLTPDQTLYTGADGQTHINWSEGPKAWQGGRGTQEARPCPRCSTGSLIATDATGEGSRMNIKTGERAFPAPHCMSCGYTDAFTPGEASGAMAEGVSVRMGEPQRAPGARTQAQAAGLHGLPNLFAQPA